MTEPYLTIDVAGVPIDFVFEDQYRVFRHGVPSFDAYGESENAALGALMRIYGADIWESKAEASK